MTDEQESKESKIARLLYDMDYSPVEVQQVIESLGRDG